MNEWSILRLWTWCMGRTRSSRSTVSVTSAISQLNYTVPTWASLGAMQLWPTRKTWLKYIQVHYHCAVWVELPSTSCSIVVICVQLDFTGRKFSHGSQDEGGMHQSESLGKKCRAEAWFSGEGARSWSESEQLQSRGWDSWNKSLIPGAQQELVSKVHSIWDTLLQAEPRMSTFPDSSGWSWLVSLVVAVRKSLSRRSQGPAWGSTRSMLLTSQCYP